MLAAPRSPYRLFFFVYYTVPLSRFPPPASLPFWLAALPLTGFLPPTDPPLPTFVLLFDAFLVG
jgi:hypothetical protein